MRIRYLLPIVLLFYLGSLVYSGRVRAALDGSDSWGYYVHLPALLLYHDTGDYAKSIAAWQSNYPGKPDPRKDAYGIRPTPTGKYAVKYPIGVALLEAPFFLVAHVFCLATNGYPADGFSMPYAWAVALSSIFYALLGLFFLFQSLRFHFSLSISLAVTAAIGVATNLYFFVVYTPGMAHPAAFCLIAYLIVATRRWYKKPSLQHSLSLGITLGLIALVRTQDLVVAVLPLAWGIRHWRDIPTRFKFWLEHRWSAVATVASFLGVLLPQVAYWEFVSGQWWYYGYQGEKFDWTHPHILDGLLGFENGWLLYTPLMWLALWGLFHLRNYAPGLLASILIFLPLHWYISYAWWCWMYINGFGSRPMIDAYALLAFPLAAWIAEQRRAWAWKGALIAFAALNIFQTWQTQQGIFWSERGNWAFYKESFGQTKGSESALAAFESREVQPPAKLQKSRLLHQKYTEVTDTVGSRPAHACKGEFHQTIEISNDTAKLLPGDWLKISVQGFVPAGQPAHSIDEIAKLVTDFSGPDGKVLKYRAINIGTHLSNPRYILWKTRGMGEWGEAAFFVQVPIGFESGSKLKVYVWNPKSQDLFIGSLSVEQWQ